MRPKLGAHVSTAGGVSNAIANAISISAECIQIFGASPQQWAAKMPPEAEIQKFHELRREHDISPVFLHAAYLINLGSVSTELYKKSIQSLSDHLSIAEALNAQGLIFHMGSSNGLSAEKAIERTISGMKAVLKNVPGKTLLICENSAGGGSKLGHAPEELGYILRAVKSSRVKVCIDTAHAFEAGLIERFTPENIRDFCNRWDDAVGLKNIVALHINDSKTGPGSHHDRHENLGEGYIGLSGFRALAKEKRLHDKTWILEVPGFDGKGPDKRNLEILEGCFTS